ncbi:hypothetical protein FGG08_004342 [Glutinoglossum americanum]|uniref:Uncharacterized protein n=1 Tax=Glutinoglossum americanum TaxID=1670608 RepID=A0A9P8I2J6_9PEZI|nr:hypothetical protein FGG08_004342 [Glutinoglossum americanum]
MLKSQVHSAFGRGRPLCAEFAKVTATSLRQFHASITALSEGEGLKEGLQTSSKTQSSDSQPSRPSIVRVPGIDARSFGEPLRPTGPEGANSPIVRLPSKFSGGFSGSGGFNGRGGFRGTGRAQPTRHIPGNANAPRGGSAKGGRGSSGFRGSGTRRRGGRGGGRGGGRRRVEESQYNRAGGEYKIDYTPEELEYLAAKEAAEKPKPVPFIPQEETLISLTPYAPQIPAAATPLGISSTLDTQLRHLASRPLDTYTRLETLTSRLLDGQPTFFENESERAEVLRMAAAQIGEKWGAVGLEGMGEEGKKEFEERLIRGEYRGLGEGEGGVVRDVGRLVGRNESFLERDAMKVVERVKGLASAKLGGGRANKRA